MSKYTPPYVPFLVLALRKQQIERVRDLINNTDPSVIKLDSYGSMKEGTRCVAGLIVTSGIFELVKNRALMYPDDSEVNDMPYPISYSWNPECHWSLARKSWDLMNQFFCDEEGHMKYCTMYGRGKYDTIVNGRGLNPMSHKDLALHRLQMGLDDVHRLATLLHSDSPGYNSLKG